MIFIYKLYSIKNIIPLIKNKCWKSSLLSKESDSLPWFDFPLKWVSPLIQSLNTVSRIYMTTNGWNMTRPIRFLYWNIKNKYISFEWIFLELPKHSQEQRWAKYRKDPDYSRERKHRSMHGYYYWNNLFFWKNIRKINKFNYLKREEPNRGQVTPKSTSNSMCANPISRVSVNIADWDIWRNMTIIIIKEK